jgi:hypothetical protein
MVALASGLPPDTFLLKYIYSKIIRKDFQSNKESNSVSVSPTDLILLYSY